MFPLCCRTLAWSVALGPISLYDLNCLHLPIPLPHLFNIIWHSNWACCLPFGYCICLNMTAWKLQLWYENLLCNVAGSINCKFVLTRLQMTFWLKNKKQWQQVKHSAITEIEKKFFWSHKVKCFSSSPGIITLRQTVFSKFAVDLFSSFVIF